MLMDTKVTEKGHPLDVSVEGAEALEAELIRARFWSKVDVGDERLCWPWRATHRGRGYGSFRIGSRKLQANRVAFLLAYGVLDESLVVMHVCDNPSCCNPLHLRQGTQAENMADCEAKGRRNHSPRITRAALTPEQVLEIRELAAAGDTPYTVLALRYGVRRNLISSVARGETYVDVGGPRTHRGSGHFNRAERIRHQEGEV
jgi:hypothetical protein